MTIRYLLYGTSWEYINHESLCDLNREYGNFLARAEDSGSEGCYVEVAKWSCKRNRWERYCCKKFLRGEDHDPAHEDWRPEQLAEHYAAEINAAAKPGQHRLPLIHRLPSAK
jgi:hypothetical protein